MIPFTVEQLRKLAPGAHLQYQKAAGVADGLFAKYGINQNRKRLAHFLAQVLHETGGFRVFREDMSYRAERIVEVFGVGKHSAKVTAAEAENLAGKPEALAERVYGLGNPKKAKELGNVRPGDGYKYRGRASMQTTGLHLYAALSKKLGVDFVANPDLLCEPQYLLVSACIEWAERGCNELADADTYTGDDQMKNPVLLKITKRVNGGYNGLSDRAAQLKKALAVLP